jgi:hypothetical protein
MAIQKYLRSSEFTYSLQSPVQGGYDGNGLSVLADFLVQKSGYCIHFASAMAVMARLEGIPSRIAVGYAPGHPTGATVSIAGQGALPEFEVDARDAHAWPELYFQGVGWVAFEPTPSRGVVPSYSTENALPGGASTNENNDGLILPDEASPTVPPQAAPVPLPGGQAPADGGTQWLPALYGAGALLLLTALAASPQLARRGVRRRRLRAGGAGGSALPAFAELRDLATDYGIAPRTSETPRHFSERLRASAALGGTEGPGAAAHGAVASLTDDFERHQYGRPAGAAGNGAGERPGGGSGSSVPDGSPGAATVRITAVHAGLRANARALVRVRAAWLPPSVMASWRETLSTPFRAASRTAKRTRHGVAGSWLRIRDAVRRMRRS